MKNYTIKSSPNKKVVILSDQPKDRISGPNIVVSSIFPFLEKKLNVKWKVCPGIRVFGSKTIPKFAKPILSSLLSFSELIFDKDVRSAEIINAHGLSSWLPSIWLAKFLKKTSLITFHETYEYTALPWFFNGGRLAQWVWNYTIKNADYIIDVSGTIKLGKAFFIPNGIDIKEFAPKKERKGKKTVLWVGRFSVEKGIEYFITASRLVRKEIDAKFIVVTNTSKDAKQNKSYARLLDSNKIEVYWQVSHDQMGKFYQEADVLVLSSLMEAFPLVLFEAMACGTPVVATNVGGVARAVKDGLVGFVVPPKNPQEIAKKTLDILKDENLRMKMSKNCVEWVKNFTWDKIAEKYLEVYKKILSRQEEK